MSEVAEQAGEEEPVAEDGSDEQAVADNVVDAPPGDDEESADMGPVDQLGIPMSREPTIDDVRGDGHEHRKLALGCSIAAIVFVGGFWLLRYVILAG